jgi:sugar phosphate isomerase/epimerase
MELAIFAKTFTRPTVGDCLHAVRGAGLTAAQFNLSVVGLPTVPAEIPDSVIEDIRSAVLDAGVNLSAISGTFNAAHPDPSVRAAFTARFPILCATAKRLGIAVITLSSGSRDPEDMWRWHPDNSTPAAWDDSRDTLRKLALIATDHDIQVAVEPEHSNVVATAELGMRMLHEVDVPALKFVYDAANLLDPDGFDEGAARRQISKDIDVLAPHIVLAHAKELTAHRAATPAGKGWLPWRHIVNELTAHEYHGPLVIHGLAEADVPTAVTTLASATRLGTDA